MDRTPPIKIERLEFKPDDYGCGFDLATRAHVYGRRDAPFVIGLFADHIEATRFVTPDDLRTIRDWIDEALALAETAA